MSSSGNKWIKKYKPKKVSSKRKKSNEFIIDETQIKFGWFVRLCRNHHRYYKISQSMHIVGYASE